MKTSLLFRLIFLPTFIFVFSIAYTQSQPSHIVWEKTLGGTNLDRYNVVQNTLDGGYIVTGTSSSNDGDVSNNNGGADFGLLNWIIPEISNGKNL